MHVQVGALGERLEKRVQLGHTVVLRRIQVILSAGLGRGRHVLPELRVGL
jgi:hypothetical protein